MAKWKHSGLELDSDVFTDPEPGMEKPRTSPLEAAASVLLERAVGELPDLPRAVACDIVMVVIEVPAAEWIDPISDAWTKLASACASKFDKPFAWAGRWLEHRSDGRDKNGWWSERIGILSAPAAGYSVVGISHAPDRYLSRDLLRAADWRIVVPPLDADALTDAVSMAFGSTSVEPLEDGLCRFLTPHDLSLARRHGQDADAYLSRLRALARQNVPKRAATTLDDLHGMEEAVGWGRALAADLAEYAAGRLPWMSVDKGVLLAGPPGTGKTTFARALAATCGVRLVSASLYQWQSAGHLGDLQRAMRKTFDEARKAAPVILLVDELDAFGDRESFSHDNRDYSIQVINGFLEEVDGTAGREGVVLIGCCNHPHRLDPAIRRSGRLDRVINVTLPDQRGLEAIFRHHLADDLAGADLSRVATLALGGTGADVERWVRGAQRRARAGGRPMTVDDLVAEVRGKTNRNPGALRVCAVHEAGHAVAWAVLAPGRLISVTVRETDITGGGTCAKPDGHFPTRDELLAKLVVLLAGRAAEQVVLGEASASSGGGEGSDLAKATTLAASMLTAYGLDDEIGLVWLGEATARNIDLFLRMRPGLEQRVSTILTHVYARSCELVREHRPAVEAAAEALIERETLAGPEVEDIVGRHLRDGRRR